MEKVNLPECSKGNWSISKFDVNKNEAMMASLRGRAIYPGTYTKVKRGGVLVMSDTPAEMRDHSYAVYKAEGSCLINGLGIGMVLKNILLKPSVKDVTVVEISQDLLDLVSPHYKDSRITWVCSDAYEYKPPKGKRYQMVWHDIWDHITADNLPQMTKLHRKYGRRADWQGSWCKAECKRYAG